MVVSKKANNPQCNLLSKGEKIKQSEISKHLGYILTSDGKCFQEWSKEKICKGQGHF